MEGRWTVDAAAAGTHTLDRKVWRGAEQGRDEGRRVGRAWRGSRAPKSHFPGSARPTPARGQGALSGFSWTTYPASSEPGEAASCRAGGRAGRRRGR